MKLKNLIYIGIIVLVVISIGLIYISSNNDSNVDTSIVNNITNANDSNDSINNSVSNSSLVVGNRDSYKSSGQKNQPSNVPKKSKLSYTEASNLATKAAKGSAADPSVKVYVKYNGYMNSRGSLYWKFNIYTSKDNKFLGGFAIEDATGKATIF